MGPRQLMLAVRTDAGLDSYLEPARRGLSPDEMD